MRRRGFTLVELAIVLVIIGLLLGAILKGKAMIENAKIKRIKSDIDSIVAAVYAYQDKYGFLPGDDPNDRTSDLGATGCDGSGANGDGLWARNYEHVCAWQELIGAGIMGGDPTIHDENLVAKRTPYGGVYLFRYANDLHGSGKSGNYIYVDNVPTEVVKQLDLKYDDGQYDSGDIQATLEYDTNRAYVDIYWFAF